MAIICWGNLAKTADSTQRIEESIQEYIETHDENPNAHMGEDYALGVHRLQAVMDHMPGSVYPQHLSPDISKIIRKEQTITQVLSEGTWVGIDQLAYQFNSSKEGTMLFIVKVIAHRKSEAGILYIRIKVNRDGVISYMPSSDGEIQWEAADIAADHRCDVIVIENLNLIEGDYAVQVEAFIDYATDGFELEANTTWQRGSLTMNSVGSEITEIE